MNKRILVRLLVILCVALASIQLFAGLPPHLQHMRERIPLGLDLRGGIQLVLRVDTNRAIQAETDQAVAAIRDEIAYPGVTRSSFDELVVSSANPSIDLQLRQFIGDHFSNWTLTSSTQGYSLRMNFSQQQTIRDRAMDQALRVMQNRLDSLGISEVAVQRYGERSDYQILLQVPGVEDPDRVKALIQATALLELRLVERGPFATAETARASYGGKLDELEILKGDPGFFVVQQIVRVSGNDLRDAFLNADENGRPAVGFKLTPDGARRFSLLTERNIGKLLAIVLDGQIQSVAQIESRIADSGLLRGGKQGFTLEQARDLAIMLRSGALPAPVSYVGGQEQLIGPALGADSIRHGIAASAIAIGAVSVIMTGYYRLTGVNAVIAMLLNLLMLLGAMALFHATLTLPGIAGIVLTIGVGIDSSVLIFERIREELRGGKPMTAAVRSSFSRVFGTLVDTHLAALISAAFLFAFGTGAVRGFAVTLVIGLVSNMFTSVFVSRTLFECVLAYQRRGSVISE